MSCLIYVDQDVKSGVLSRVITSVALAMFRLIRRLSYLHLGAYLPYFQSPPSRVSSHTVTIPSSERHEKKPPSSYRLEPQSFCKKSSAKLHVESEHFRHTWTILAAVHMILLHIAPPPHLPHPSGKTRREEGGSTNKAFPEAAMD